MGVVEVLVLAQHDHQMPLIPHQGPLQHHRPDLSMRCRAPGPALARPARPPAADDVAVPPQDGARSDDQPHHGEPVDRQRPGQQGKQRPVRPRQPSTSPRPLTPGDSELVAQQEDLGVLPPRLPARQAQQRHNTGNDQEDQLQAHKPKIIPPPVGPRPARHMPNARPRAAGLCPGGTGFRHPQVAACSVVDAATLVVGSACPVGGVMSGLLIGYARGSTEGEDLTAQRDGLDKLGVEPPRIDVDHGLPGTNRERPGLRESLAACRAGDTLVVTKLDRLARSLPDARAIAENLTERKVRLSLGASVYDPTDPVGRLLFNVLAMVAEFEADLIRSRTREGMRVAKAKGHLRGKQPKLNPRQEAHLVELLYSGEYSTAELGDLFGVARSTVYRVVARSKKPAASGQRAKRHPGTDFTCRADGDRQQLPLWYRQHVDHHIPAAARRSQ